MLPFEYDRSSFREILLVIRATEDGEREKWKRTATLATYIYNFATPKKKGYIVKNPDDLFPDLYGESSRVMADFDERWEAAQQQEKRYLAERAKADARRASEAQT